MRSGHGQSLASRIFRRCLPHGDETFKQRLLDLIRDKGSAGEADSHTGPAVWARAEVDASQRIERGLATLGIAGEVPAGIAHGGSGEAGAGLVVAATHDPVSKVDRWPPSHGPRKPRYPRGEGSLPVPPRPPGANAQPFGEDVRRNKNILIKLSDYGTDPFIPVF